MIMRKTFFCLLAAVSMSSAAQTKLVRFGLEGGLNVNKLSLSYDALSSDNRCGFFVGPKMLVKIPLLGLGADAALLYNFTGANLNKQTQNDENSITENLSYLQIPLNARYDISFLKILGAYIATGPQYSVCLNSMETINNVGIGGRSTWGWNIGAGIKVLDKIHVGATYTIPLNSTELYVPNAIGVISSKQKTVQIRIAYIF